MLVVMIAVAVVVVLAVAVPMLVVMAVLVVVDLAYGLQAAGVLAATVTHDRYPPKLFLLPKF